MGETWRRAGVRLLAAALLAVASTFSPGVAREALAIDCGLVFCATLEVVPSPGAGVGHMTTEGGEIDCTWNGAFRSGTCAGQFSWPHFLGGSIDVGVTLDPDSKSYVCYGPSCFDLDVAVIAPMHLNAGDDKDLFMVFNLGDHLALTIDGRGTGNGRVTANLGGIDCTATAGVESGACAADIYFTPGGSHHVDFVDDPADNTYVCKGSSCYQPNATLPSGYTFSGSTTIHYLVEFYPAIPVSISLTGSGSVTSAPAGISCPPTCSKWFPPNRTTGQIVLTATPAAGWYVKSWNGRCTISGTSCSFRNDEDGESISVVFARTVTTTPEPSAGLTPQPTTPHPTTGPATGSSAPAASRGPAQPSGQIGASPGSSPAASPEASSGGAAASSDTPAPSSPPAQPAAAPGSPLGAGSDALLLVVVALVVGVGIGLGGTGLFLFGRSRGRASRGDPDR